MTDDVVRRWLAERRPAPPPVLAARIDGEAGGGEGPTGPFLARRGLAVLSRVTADPDCGRERAADLLAADALLTYAFEAQAEQDVTGLERLAEWVAREGGEVRG